MAKRITNALRDGNTRRAACAVGGICEDTLQAWLKRYSDFSDAIKRAEAEAESKHVATITKAAKAGNWTASAWWLERRYPEDWGRRDKVDIRVVIDRERERIRKQAETEGLDADFAIAEFERMLRDGART